MFQASAAPDRYKGAIRIMAIPILSICPASLIVPTTLDATPRCFFSTELIMALELGEEKRANPTPIIISMVIIRYIGLSAVTKHNIIRPDAVSPMPQEAIT